MHFKSKVDAWFYAVLIGSVIVVIGAVLPIVQQPSLVNFIFVGSVLLVAAGLPLWLLAGTRYLVEDGMLTIRSGPFKWSIRLDEIRSVQPSRSLLSSPALSLDRLKIVYGAGKQVLVSPRDREAFLRAIGHETGTR